MKFYQLHSKLQEYNKAFYLEREFTLNKSFDPFNFVFLNEFLNHLLPATLPNAILNYILIYLKKMCYQIHKYLIALDKC